ncbi:RimK family alpha-L-glutamate ligase [Erythrobacter sp. MTPC3]|uniref:ATP-grasp domain-containing protein n=1 Tax=Erythrobacter sp. MTPC3 TaxID=3056564 RepID=UPI0036F1B9FC
MTAIGFLACETTLPSAGERRGDAFEHDLMIAALEPAFAAKGLELRVIDWEAPLAEFDGLALVMLGTAWDYQDKAEAFLAKLEGLEKRGIIVCNSSSPVRWNASKTYLKELALRGARTIPTIWLNDVTPADAQSAMNEFECDTLVVKRQVGAGAIDQVLLRREALPETGWTFGHRAMLQPFLPAIAEEGELSFIFIDGAFSHALRKVPAAGDYRIQSLYGGIESVYAPSADEADAAAAIIRALPFPAPLYARIDMLRAEDGGLMVMEAEMIEPYLYPEQGPDLGEKLAAAVLQRVS